MKIKIVPRSFYIDDTPDVAKKLLGQLLISYFENEYAIGMITQTEAYRSDDPASHSFRGKTKRNVSMFGPCGHAYVYRSYGIHNCFNVVARSEDYPSGGVLIRTLYPIKGITIMQRRRGRSEAQRNRDLANGPGKLTQALGIQKEHDGLDLTNADSPLVIAEGVHIQPEEIQASPRIGISKATDTEWCFTVSNQLVHKHRISRLSALCAGMFTQ